MKVGAIVSYYKIPLKQVIVVNHLSYSCTLLGIAIFACYVGDSPNPPCLGDGSRTGFAIKPKGGLGKLQVLVALPQVYIYIPINHMDFFPLHSPISHSQLPSSPHCSYSFQTPLSLSVSVTNTPCLEKFPHPTNFCASSLNLILHSSPLPILSHPSPLLEFISNLHLHRLEMMGWRGKHHEQ